jgi:hypothetical protein
MWMLRKRISTNKETIILLRQCVVCLPFCRPIVKAQRARFDMDINALIGTDTSASSEDLGQHSPKASTDTIQQRTESDSIANISQPTTEDSVPPTDSHDLVHATTEETTTIDIDSDVSASALDAKHNDSAEVVTRNDPEMVHAPLEDMTVEIMVNTDSEIDIETMTTSASSEEEKGEENDDNEDAASIASTGSTVSLELSSPLPAAKDQTNSSTVNESTSDNISVSTTSETTVSRRAKLRRCYCGKDRQS